MNDTYTVKTPVFEGPLELLLELVEKRKLFVNDISLAEVTDEYIAYVRSMESRNMSSLASFVIIAATLVLVKSRSLLPTLSLSEEEEGEISDLEERLRLYKIFKEAGTHIQKMFGKTHIFERQAQPEKEPVWAPDKNITKETLYALVSDVIRSVPKKESIPKTEVKKVINIEEMIAGLHARIEEGIRMSFKDFARGSSYSAGTKEHKVFVIVGFLAMLELVRQGIVDVLQDAAWGDITIHKTDEHATDGEEDTSEENETDESYA